MNDKLPTPVPAIATPETDAALTAAGIPWGQQKTDDAKLAEEHRQQTSGYDMSHTGVNSTLVNNTVLEALREKARFFDMSEEARQVAGMLCMDIDLLADIASNEDMTIARLKRHVERLKESKETLLNDPKAREQRYAAAQMLINCGAFGADPRTEGHSL